MPSDRKDCSLVLFEIGFCRDLGCHEKLAEKTDKYQPLLRALRRYWGRVELICIPIGHAGTTLLDTATAIAAALAKVRPSMAAERKRKGARTPDTSKTAFVHNKRVATTLLDKLCSLAQTRLLGIIAHRQQLIRERTALGKLTLSPHPITHTPKHTPRPPSTAIV